MTEQAATRLSLELTHLNGPIAGRLTNGAHEVEFVGWLALAAALESARNQTAATVERESALPSSTQESTQEEK